MHVCDREGSRCNICKEQRQWKWMSVNTWGQPSKTIMHKRDNEVEYQGWSVTDGQAARMKGDPYKMGETSSGWVSEARLRWFGHVLDVKLREGKVNNSGSSSCGNTINASSGTRPGCKRAIFRLLSGCWINYDLLIYFYFYCYFDVRHMHFY